jgi:hypothetical protein
LRFHEDDTTDRVAKGIRESVKKRPRTTARKAEAAIDPRFAPVMKAFAGDPKVSFGMMVSSFGLKVNGKIFAMMVRGKFVAKLPKARVDAIVATGVGENFDPGHGRLMKEWVANRIRKRGLDRSGARSVRVRGARQGLTAQGSRDRLRKGQQYAERQMSL